MIRRSSVRRGAGAAAAFALAATVVAGAVVAQPEGAQAAVTSSSSVAVATVKGPLLGAVPKPFYLPETNITSLTAKSGVLSLGMTSELFASQQRIVVWVDDTYVGETFGGKAVGLDVSTGSNGTVTLSRRVPADAIIRVGTHAGKTGDAVWLKTTNVVRTALEGDMSISQLANGTLAWKVPAGTLNSMRRLVLFVNGAYAGETCNGTGYYVPRSADGAATFFTQSSYKKGDRVEVRLVAGYPGYSTDGGEVLLSQTL